MSAGRTDWVAVGRSVLRESARRRLVARLFSNRVEVQTTECRIGGVSADMARAAASLVSRLPLIAMAHPIYGDVVTLDFDSVRTLETWFLNEPAGAEQELARRLNPSADDPVGLRETKRRWQQARAGIDQLVVRGRSRVGLSPRLDRWRLTDRLRKALTSAAEGNRTELESISSAYKAVGFEDIFLDGLAGLMAAQVQGPFGIDPTLLAYVCDTADLSASIFAVAKIAVSRAPETHVPTLNAIAAHHGKAAGADHFLASLTRGQRQSEPVTPARDARANRASYVAFRHARLSEARFVRLALSSARPLPTSSSRSSPSDRKSDEDRR